MRKPSRFEWGRVFSHPNFLNNIVQLRWNISIFRMKQYGFETVLSMRLMYLNWDLVSYLAGFIGVPVRGFRSR